MSDRGLDLPAHVASLAPRELADARRLARLVPAGAGAIEYRLDLATEKIPASALLALDPRPVLVTWRSSREGGSFTGSAEEYRTLVAQSYDAGAFVDVEHASGLLSERDFLPDRRRVVSSAHFPFGLPPDAAELVEAMSASGVLAAKLVAGAADLASSLQVAALQAVGRLGAAAVFPMGPASAPGRVLSAHLGSALVFGSVEISTARGQLALADLLEVYGTSRPRRPEALFGIVAADPAASLSPRVHNALFRSRDLPWLYLPLPVADFDRERPHELDGLPAPFHGFSVTRPWKEAAAGAGIPSEDVRACGAANTLRFSRSRWRAENTDVDGIFDPLADHDTGEGRSAVVLGAGGTARAAIVAAKKIGYEVAVSSRRDDAADALGAEMKIDSVAWSDLPATEADLYVNATPVGSSDEDPSAIPERVLDGRPLVFDCVYRQSGDTPTIAAARRFRCPFVTGMTMFAAQAVRQARLFGIEDARLAEIEALLPGAAA
ncbi:MAG TPA: type I 3-dehydroquinate dehydratase [Thermoanaerobaculia bacterium]|nr:type I 3-dehydroquinate dehydratase [Thermoanaerobaculia bacterium]